jgi:small neutral amino acid transporter SnatA (MarC family)
MNVKDKTLEKFGDVLINLGQVSLIAGVGSLFLKEPGIWIWILGIAGGLILISVGLYVINKTK